MENDWAKKKLSELINNTPTPTEPTEPTGPAMHYTIGGISLSVTGAHVAFVVMPTPATQENKQ